MGAGPAAASPALRDGCAAPVVRCDTRPVPAVRVRGASMCTGTGTVPQTATGAQKALAKWLLLHVPACGEMLVLSRSKS